MEKQSAFSYHLVLLSENDALRDLWLPAVPEGFLRFSDKPEHRFLSISAQDGYWTAVCRKPAFFQNVPIENSYDIRIEDGLLLKAEFEDRQYTLFAEKVDSDRLKLKNYFVSSDVVISIGAHSDCDICHACPHIADRHATIWRTDGRWTIRECNDAGDVYVNGNRNRTGELKIGDSIYLFGLRIVIGPSYLAINSDMEPLKLSANLQPYTVQQGGYSRYYGQELLEKTETYFNRLPRKRLKWEPQAITVEGPPMPLSNAQIPLMLRMGGTMIRGGTAALAGNFMTLITSVLFPVLSSKYTDRQRNEYEKLRVSKYTEYLEMKRLEIAEAGRQEQAAINKQYPNMHEVVRTVMDKTRLWERRPVDDDFLHVRIGAGVRPMKTPIDYPERRFQLESDILEDQMYALVEKEYTLDNMPIILPLMEDTVCGILGDEGQRLTYIRNLVLQIAACHSYDEVKMVFLMGESELKQLDCLRYLPHVWDDQRSVRYIATKEAEAYALGENIKKQFEMQQDEDGEQKKRLRNQQYYVIFALDKKLLESHEIMKEILQSDSNCGVSIVAAYDDLPKETRSIITLKSNQESIYTSLGRNGSEDVKFSLDDCGEEAVAKAMSALANISLRSVTQSQALPKMVAFLEMFKAGRVEQLNPLQRWRENNPVKSLAAPVGVGEDGSLFMLDLHEKRQGPHGLVAGMTGSGKSEFLISYILSMAVNYHPDEVAFVLIDYKGGGLADAFENPRTGMRLPHLAGTITNLDGGSIQRSLMSIESELVRRQKVFSEVSKNFDEGSMNIYTYQKLYREGKVSTPMPHLFIISDEFAELKQQQPEFMDKLISAARIGRSLGVHLILATQKPSGVVNDQIRSNTKFRVCLRVQDRADSMDMLKRPEAAELTDTGRFYLQVGYNEFFALGQSAWCGADYEPQDTVPTQRDDAIEFLDTMGQLVTKAKPKVKKISSGMKQIVAVVSYLSNLAKAQGIQVRQLCQPELEKKLDLETLRSNLPDVGEESMTVRLGLVDDPENQQQFPLELDMAACQNLLIVGEAGSGKTSMLQSILYSLTQQLTAQDLHFYALDYSARMMKMYTPLPHCGAVLYEEDIGLLDAFFDTVGQIIEERKKLFTELEVDNFESARSVKRLPLVLVLIDNYSGMTATKKGDSLSYTLADMVKESAAYGVKFLITANRLGDLNSRMKRAVGDRICLYQADKYGYTDVLGVKPGYTPPEIPGRGLCLQQGRALEYQCAQFRTMLNRKDQLQQMKEEMRALAERSDRTVEARQLPVTDETAEYRDFARQFARGRIPLGYSKATGNTVALPLKQYSALTVYFGNPEGVIPVMENLLYVAGRENMELWIMRRNENSIYLPESEQHVDLSLLGQSDVLECTVDNQRLLQKALMATMNQRWDFLEDYCRKQGLQVADEEKHLAGFAAMLEQTKPILLVIESVADFCSALSPVAAMSYQSIVEKLAKRNIYLVACMGPDEHLRFKEDLFSASLKKHHALLLGGQFQNQVLCAVPSSPNTDKLMPYNVGIMRYRDQYHPVVMPCGLLEVKKEDEDLKSIF